jgi:ATP-dependent 26S proteasome regulatory subunit
MDYGSRYHYILNENILKAAKNEQDIDINHLNEPIKKFDDIHDLLDYIFGEVEADRIRVKLLNFRSRRNYYDEDEEEMIKNEFDTLIKNHTHIPFIKYVHQNLNLVNAYIYLFIVWEYILGCPYSDVQDALDRLKLKRSDKIKYIKKLNDKSNQLIDLNLIEEYEVTHPFKIDLSKYKLTEKSINTLIEFKILSEDVKNKQSKVSHTNVIQHKDIKPIQLYFNKNTKEQIERLFEIFSDESIKEIQTRLKENGMPSGITVLLYGYPGTGKTEVCKQLAYHTKRDIFHIEISSIRSMFYGETEKNIQKIFEQYKRLAQSSEKTPILLFNEMDAILGKRTTMEFSTSRVENIIQNVILEHLENFEGILLATTNIIKNIDPAFERRFLFKVEFEKPSERIRSKIWKDKLPFLSEEDCMELASKFEFSGGQIANIQKKCLIYKITNGQDPNYFIVEKFCEEEEWDVKDFL